MAKRKLKPAMDVVKQANDLLENSYFEMWALDDCARHFPETGVSVFTQRAVFKMLGDDLVSQWEKAKRLLDSATGDPRTGKGSCASQCIESAMHKLKLLVDDTMNDDAGGEEYDAERKRIESGLTLGLFTAAAHCVNEAVCWLDGDHRNEWHSEWTPKLQESNIKEAA